MDAKFTTKSQEALSAAAMNASTAGNPQVEPAHLLKALMDQRESVAVAVLKAAGADPDAVSTAASSAIRRLPSTQGSTVAQPQFSRAALQVVQNARTQAEQRSDEFVSTEHLLLGVAADSGEAGEALRSNGASLEALAADLGRGVEVCGDEALDDADLVINALSIRPDFDLARLRADAVVMDMTYRPVVTPLLQAARTRGLVTVDGLAMLIGQAAPLFEAAFGQAPPPLDLRMLLIRHLEAVA